MNTFRILLADDHPVFRMGVSTLIRSHEGWEVCGEAADGREAVTKCTQLKPDLLVLDICMPNLNGLDAACQILKHNPDQKILVLTNVESDQVIRGCLQAGVRGWVLKSDRADELAAAIEALQWVDPASAQAYPTSSCMAISNTTPQLRPSPCLRDCPREKGKLCSS